MNVLNITDIPIRMLVIEIHPGSIMTVNGDEYLLPDELLGWSTHWIIMASNHKLQSGGRFIEFGIVNNRIYAEFLNI